MKHMSFSTKKIARGCFLTICFFFCVSTALAGTQKKGKADVDAAVYKKYNGIGGLPQAEWGPLNCHDPKLFQDDDGTYYVYSTDASIGNVHKRGIQVRSSTDLVHWTCSPKSVLQGNWDEDMLDWVGFNSVSATTWAPTVIKQNGLYYMYHGLMTDGRSKGQPTACITLAVATSPEGPFYPAAEAAQKDDGIAQIFSKLGVTYKQSILVRYAWNAAIVKKCKDSESYNLSSYNTVLSQDTRIQNWNGGFGAIDPEFVYDVADGTLKKFQCGNRACYGVTYGSWKGGIALMYVDSVSLKPVTPDGTELDRPADTVQGAFGTLIAGGMGAAYEGSQVIYNSKTGYYYIFVSMGDLSYDYRVGTGRSKDITGPYLDASGKDMKFSRYDLSGGYHAYGSKIIGATQFRRELAWRCPGGESILRTKDGKIMFACHTRTNFLPGYFFYLQVHQMFFTSDGWPVLNQNEYYNDYDGNDEALSSLTVDDIAGTYEAVLTRRTDKNKPFTPYQDKEVNFNGADEKPEPSSSMVLHADGSITGSYSGTWSLAEDGFSIELSTKKGIFKGYVLRSVDWARKGHGSRKTITFTTICDKEGDTGYGEYFFGNRTGE